MKESKERSAQYVNDLYKDHIDLENEDKIKILEEINLYMEVTMAEEGISRKELIRNMFATPDIIPEDIISCIEWMVNSHYKMIISISNSSRRKYQNSVSVNDLIYYGIYGIYRGALNYDPTRTSGDINVGSFMNQWISVYISKGANTIRNSIVLPKSRITKGDRTTIFSIDSFGSSDTDEPDTLHDILSTPPDSMEDENGANMFIREDMNNVLENSLNEKELSLVKLLFGIECDLLSIREIAELRGVTVQMIYSQRKDILTKLRQVLR
jgi:RNA polymerase sigma factor (sigma-70 family)